ncbi:THUMP domain-containing class I SAM-dependent RNA methyltransferase [Pseudooceanicola algae]|uniref:Ribosomal RNA large subunit methyltransferase L n=1 Tax=Pseudooceanicola algae TaxID=1537215 RepID=A0A418SEJ9_9RHOB|nr:class I SAM-dependent RNA methyltransferase [Pseudooceanicola algae]QPM89796.1 Ribosomal RNA large subunit methyltransferase L [Pseudooceanicola algae]
MSETFEIFCAVAPGLEDALSREMVEAGFSDPIVTPGGVSFEGNWQDVQRANLVLRGAARVLARIGGFPAFHLAQLDKRARKFPWGDFLRRDMPVRVDVVTNRKSKIYHGRAAQQRIETALKESLGVDIGGEEALVLKARIDDNLVTFSLDTSGEPLHRRGHKVAVGKAPMRETLAALFLRECGYCGDEPVLDPMCGSGTFLLEAAEMAVGLAPGRERSFAFEKLAGFNAAQWAEMKGSLPVGLLPPADSVRFHGSDRDSGAVGMAGKNAERAGLAEIIDLHCAPISALERPAGPPGLVITNPPYGARIGNKNLLYALYGSFGKVMAERFSGWRVGIVTSEPGLAKATGLPLLPPGAPVSFGSLKVQLWRTEPLP